MSAWTRALQSTVLVAGGVILIVTAAVTGRSLWSGTTSIVVGSVLLMAAGLLSVKNLHRMYAAHHAVRRGIRQIETVLKLEAALSTRRLTVAGANAGCPICGAPPGPHCVCRKQ